MPPKRLFNIRFSCGCIALKATKLVVLRYAFLDALMTVLAIKKGEGGGYAVASQWSSTVAPHSASKTVQSDFLGKSSE